MGIWNGKQRDTALYPHFPFPHCSLLPPLLFFSVFFISLLFHGISEQQERSTVWGKVKKLSKKFNKSRGILCLCSFNCCGVCAPSMEFFLKALCCKQTIKSSAVHNMSLCLGHYDNRYLWVHCWEDNQKYNLRSSLGPSYTVKLWWVCRHRMIILLSYSITVCSTYVPCLQIPALHVMLLIRLFPFNAIAALKSYAYTPTYAIIHQKDY